MFIAKVAFKYMAMSNRIVYGNRWVRFLTLPENNTMDLAGEDFIRLRERTKCLIVQGGLYRDEQSFYKYVDKIRTFFALISVHKEHVKNLWRRSEILQQRLSLDFTFAVGIIGILRAEGSITLTTSIVF